MLTKKIATTPEKIIPPSEIGEWTFARTVEVLSRPIPRGILKKLKDKGNADYVPWYEAVKILNKYCPGWTNEIRNIWFSDQRIFINVRITIFCRDGSFYHEATGTETLLREKVNRATGEVVMAEHAYGDPSSNAESMALRRAAAKFGLGLYLYQKK